MADAASMEFTGERFVPTLDGQIKYEHLHRYALVLDFAAGKSVLDIACGEGYGAALMARVAERVVGVDISQSSIEHARRNYYYQNLEFLTGACEAVPLPDDSVDLVTSFETIEHHDRHEEMMSEIKRVLKPGGVLIISSPNRLTYSDEPNYSNPFHVRELYYDEFHSLLSRHFKHIQLFGQRIAAGSFVYRLQGADSDHLKSFAGDADQLANKVCRLPSPIYFIAVCSDAVLSNPEVVNSIYLDDRDDLWKRAEVERQDLFKQVQEQLARLGEEHRLQEALERNAVQLSASEENVRQLEGQARRQAAELSSKDAGLASKEAELSVKAAELSAKEAELSAVKVHLSSAEEIIARKEGELSQAQARLSASEEQVGSQTRELSALRGQLSTLREQLSTLRRQESALRDQLATARQAGGEYEGRTARQAGELAELRAHISGQGAQLQRLSGLLSEARARLSNKQALLSWMFHSRSWKVTTPLRQLSLQAGRIRRSLSARGRELFNGYVDSPVEGAKADGQLQIVGWAYSAAAPVARVEAFLDNMPLGALSHGQARPDVVEAFPALPTPDCGYAQSFTLDEMFAGLRTLLIRVTDERGNFEDYTRTVIVEPDDDAAHTPEIAPAPLEVAGTLDEPFFGDRLSLSKKLLGSLAETYLENFLNSNATVELPRHEEPEVSVILVLYNRAELTLQCLLSLLKSNTPSFEVVIVDNASTDATRSLLKRIKGAHIIENQTNVHFLRACNQAARHVRGRYVLLLNNDTQVVSGSISSAVETLNSADDIGAVGGKIILPDGSLQEAGSIIWRDGSCAGYGRGDSPSAPAYMFRRDVDYCSGAFLLTRRESFVEAGGFDESFAPAYYEETDFCVRLWKQGRRIVYDPNAVVIHYEFASSGSPAAAIELQERNKKVFADRHRDWLASKPAAAPSELLAARDALRPGARRILFIDDRVPHVNLGSGFPRSNGILAELIRLGHFVTFYPINFPQEDWADVYSDVPREVEVMLDRGVTRLEEFLRERAHYYDFIFVSRPHNMTALKAVLARDPSLRGRAEIIYDAEALFSLRDIEQRRAEGRPLSHEQGQKLIREELGLASDCHRVVSVSVRESAEFTRFGFERVHTLGHSITISPTPADFDERRGILFVGAVHAADSPNADSVIWFSEEILPIIRRRAGADIRLVAAGPVVPEIRDRLADLGVQVMGTVEDLTPFYDRARIFVAPTRFAAGIPHKVQGAAANGLPVVATSLIGSQLGWADGEALLLADDADAFADACVRLYQDPELWGRLRQKALERIGVDCSPETFSQTLKAIFA